MIEDRLKELGFELTEAPAPAANYVPAVRSGNLLFISGQVSVKDGKNVASGHLGKDVTVEEGYAAAQQCALNLLSQVRTALGGDLSRLVRVVKLTGFVASAPDFNDQPKVVNGCSDLMVEALGDAGRHSRSAVGVAALPLNVAVEIEGIFEVRD